MRFTIRIMGWDRTSAYILIYRMFKAGDAAVSEIVNMAGSTQRCIGMEFARQSWLKACLEGTWPEFSMAREMNCRSLSSSKSLSSSPYWGRCVACGILYFTPSGYHYFSTYWLARLFWQHGSSNSSRDTDPSAVSTLSCCFPHSLWQKFWGWLVLFSR